MKEMYEHWFIVAVFLVQNFSQFGSDFVRVVGFCKKMHEEIPESEHTTDDAQKKINLVRS